MEVTKEIFSLSNKYKSVIFKKDNSDFYIDVFKWDEEWEVWNSILKRKLMMVSFQRAYDIAVDQLKNYSGESEFQIDEINKLAIVKNKSVLVACLLSILFPGIGQIYNGHIKRGMFFLITPIALLILSLVSYVCFAVIMGFLAFIVLEFFYVLFIIYWIMVAFDALIKSMLIRKGFIKIKDRIQFKKSTIYTFFILSSLYILFFWFIIINFTLTLYSLI